MIIQKTIKRKKVIAIMAIVLLVLGGSIAALFYFRDQNSTPEGSDYPSKTHTETDEALERSKQEASNQDGAKTNDTPTSQQQVSQFTPTINAATFESDGTIVVRAMVSEVASGNCSLTAESPSGMKITQDAKVGLVSNYYACQGFVIPAEQVREKGNWTITVVYRETNGNASQPVSRKVLVY